MVFAKWVTLTSMYISHTLANVYQLYYIIALGDLSSWFTDTKIDRHIGSCCVIFAKGKPS